MPLNPDAYLGSETVTTAEHSLTTDTAGPDETTADGVFNCTLDLSALANGDAFRFLVYEKVAAAGTQRKVDEAVFTNVQGSPHPQLGPWSLKHGWDMTLTKLAGTDRAIVWSIDQIDG
jgi:hypothetical protein